MALLVRKPDVAARLKPQHIIRPFQPVLSAGRKLARQSVAVPSATSAEFSTFDTQQNRRNFLLLLATGAAAVVSPTPAQAFTPPPSGYRLHVDKLDGYYFLYPEGWAPVTTSGNDVFFRNPFNVEQNLFVDVTSPSSSRFSSIEDLGSPEMAAQKLLDQILNREFMSTRLGIRREGQVVSATQRIGGDGKTYYDIDIELKSYASKAGYLVSDKEMLESYGLEWDRHFITTLGVANKRLYQLRMQTAASSYETSRSTVETISESFRCREVEL